jgi:hypothetical protein
MRGRKGKEPVVDDTDGIDKVEEVAKKVAAEATDEIACPHGAPSRGACDRCSHEDEVAGAG